MSLEQYATVREGSERYLYLRLQLFFLMQERKNNSCCSSRSLYHGTTMLQFIFVAQLKVSYCCSLVHSNNQQTLTLQ